MVVLFLAGVLVVYSAEARGNPLLHGIDQRVSAMQPGGNMEDKEVRFGIADSALFAAVTTDASCGAVNGMHDSFTPLGGMLPLINMMLGEVVFGGVGSGLYGMLVFVILAVFIAGLMVGRTPEYLGKKIEAYDVKMATLSVLIFCLVILTFTAVSVVSSVAKSSISNAGPHGLTQILYAYVSTAANNGSAFSKHTRYSFAPPRDLIVINKTMPLGRSQALPPRVSTLGLLNAKPNPKGSPFFIYRS